MTRRSANTTMLTTRDEVNVSMVSQRVVSRFDFECFKRFLVRLNKKCYRNSEQPDIMVTQYFLPLLNLDGRALRKDML
jgi:hypothetical protein